MDEGPARSTDDAAAERTETAAVPVRDWAASVAVIDHLPAVINVADVEPSPLTSVRSGGSTARGSLLVKWTVPLYLASGFP